MWVTDTDRHVVRWVAVIGAVSGGDVRARFRLGRTAGYRRLSVLADHGLLARSRLVYGPADAVHGAQGRGRVGRHAAARARPGRRSDDPALGDARASPSASSAPSVEVWGEPRLRAAELKAEGSIASAALGQLPDGRPRLRRPDLVLFPDAALPVGDRGRAVGEGIAQAEAAICRALARCPIVSEVRYYAPPHVTRAVSRAVSSVRADGRDPHPAAR